MTNIDNAWRTVMKLTLDQLKDLDAAGKRAHEALKEVDRVLSEILIQSMKRVHKRGDDKLTDAELKEVAYFVSVIEDRLHDARFVTQSLQMGSEWLGGDSSEADNHALKEPQALNLAGLVPRVIEGTRGVQIGDL